MLNYSRLPTFSKLTFSKKFYQCQMVWIQIRTDVLSVHDQGSNCLQRLSADDLICRLQGNSSIGNNALLSFSAIIDLIDENGNLSNIHQAKKDEDVSPRFEERTNYIPVMLESKINYAFMHLLPMF